MKTTKKFLLAIILLIHSIGYSQIPPCSGASMMPYDTTSVIYGSVTGPVSEWYSFVPITKDVKITLNNINESMGHIHDMLLFEGVCGIKTYIIGRSSGNMSTLTINVHDLLPGIPYYIRIMRERTSCPRCISIEGDFSLTVNNLNSPIITENNNIVFLNGKPSHMKNEVIFQMSSKHLKMINVQNLNLDQLPVATFIKPAMIQSMANKFFNGNHIGLGQLHLKRVYTNLSVSDSISISRIGESMHVPEFWSTFILVIPDSMSVFKTGRLISDINGVHFAEPNFVVNFGSVPNDDLYTSQASLHPTVMYPNGHINIQDAWDNQTGESFVKIGVYDTGIDQDHDDLTGKVAGGYNYYNSTPLTTPYDDHGHGTSCAGIIGANRNNNNGVAGIAGGDILIGQDGCSLYDMHIGDVSSFASNSTIANAIVTGGKSTSAGGYGLHIMSNSWSGIEFSRSIYDAVQFAVQSGVTFAVSRGNFPNAWGTTVDEYMYPACLQDEMVICVGACGVDGELKISGNGNPSDASDNDYSSMTTKGVDIIAPGTNATVYTTETGTNNYHGFNGTSAACPHVAGVAGLILSEMNSPTPSLSNLTIEDVENLLQRNATDKSTPNYDAETGFGLINATSTLSSIQPSHKIQHFGVAQDASATITSSLLDNNAEMVLTMSYGGLAPGVYYGEKHLVTITLNYSLDSPTDQIISFWPRFSSTNGWSGANPIELNNWCQIVSVSNTQAVLRTYIYNFLYNENGALITDPWFPSTIQQAKAALSIYTVDPSVAGLNNALESKFSFKAFPNPANDNVQFNFSLLNEQDVNLSLYDSQGKLIKVMVNDNLSSGNHEINVQVNDLSEGMYYYTFTTENEIYSNKLIIRN